MCSQYIREVFVPCSDRYNQRRPSLRIQKTEICAMRHEQAGNLSISYARKTMKPGLPLGRHSIGILTTFEDRTQHVDSPIRKDLGLPWNEPQRVEGAQLFGLEVHP